MKVGTLRRLLEHYPDDAQLEFVDWEDVDSPTLTILNIQLVAAEPDYVHVSLVRKEDKDNG
jgi:hypothetical protein